MLAYRHAFHAGNHADVLKHTVLALVLRYMNQKDKPYRLVDTHAGAGGYSLKFACMPALIWIAFRFDQRTAASAMLLLAVQLLR